MRHIREWRRREQGIIALKAELRKARLQPTPVEVFTACQLSGDRGFNSPQNRSFTSILSANSANMPNEIQLPPSTELFLNALTRRRSHSWRRTVPTIVDVLIDAYFTRLEASEQMKRAETAFAGFMKNMERLFEPIGAATLAIAKSPPSPGYEPFFVRRGADPVLARMMALVLVHRGRRIEAESRRHRAVVEAVRFLAKPDRRSSSIVRRATVLLAAWNESSAIESIFRNAPPNSIMEFAEALKGAATGDVGACERAMAIAAVFLLLLSNPPGPKISAASAAHEFFLEGQAENGRPSGYTWNPIDQKFVDELTIATRREFADPDFDPRPAHRRFKARERATKDLSRRTFASTAPAVLSTGQPRNKLS